MAAHTSLAPTRESRPAPTRWHDHPTAAARTRYALRWLALIVLALLFIFPLLWMLSTALKPLSETTSAPPTLWPKTFQWSNFADAVRAVPMGQYLVNSIAYAAVTVVGEVLSCSLVAFGFAFLRFRHRNIIFAFVLATMMLPFEVQIIPQFLLFRQAGWIDTYLPLIVPAFFGNPYLIFLLRQFFRGIPRSTLDAAMLDGANLFMVWWRIVLPQSKPALAAVAVFSFMFHWNDLTGPLIYLNANEKYPAALGLQQFTSTYGGTAWNLLMAASLIVLVPPILVFFFSQRYMISGITVNRPPRGGREDGAGR